MKTKKRPTRRTPSAPPPAAAAQQALRDGWRNALAALARAESAVETRVRALLRNNKINVEDAAELLREFKQGVEKERARGMRDLEAGLGRLRQRVEREGKNVGKAVDDAVQSGLAALNIPTRREVALLTRKVDELSRRIGTLKRRKR